MNYGIKIRMRGYLTSINIYETDYLNLYWTLDEYMHNNNDTVYLLYTEYSSKIKL